MPYKDTSQKVHYQQPQTWRILGRRFGLLREQKGFSLRGISRSLNISPSLISAIENGKTTAHTDTLSALYKAIGHPLTLDDSWLSEASAKLDYYIQMLYEENDPDIKKSLEAIVPYQSTLADSPLYVDYTLFLGIVELVDHQKPLSSEVMALYDYYEDLSLNQRDLLNVTAGYEAFLNGNYTFAQSHFESVLNHHINTLLDSLAHSHLAMIMEKRFRFYDAIKHAQEASRFHAQNNNLKRKIEMDFLQLKCLIQIRQLDEAQRLYDNLSYLLTHYLKDYQKTLLFHQCYLAFVKKNYTEALTLLSNEKNLPLQFVLFKSHLLVLTEQKDEALKLIKKSLMSRRAENEILQVSKFYYQSLTTHYEHEETERFIHEFIKNPNRFEYLELIQELFKMAIEYAHRFDRINLIKAISNKVLEFYPIR